MECESWKKYKLNKDISIGIVPQMSSNISGVPEQINYDLDTSIVIQSNISKEVFYNGVDNPLTVNHYKVVKKFIMESCNEGYKKLLVVTGKGLRSQVYNDPYRSEKMSTLKHSVPEYIKNDDDLLSKVKKITSADSNHGGDGAIYIFLK